jgi:protein-S-isoprenylcysteine O-methyltransferase Ste14
MSAPSGCSAGGAGTSRWKIMPPNLFFGLLVANVAIALLVPQRGLDPTPYNFVGLAVVALGIVLNLWSDHQLKVAGTTVKPYGQPTALITGGSFRISRNPMYLGMALILAGAAWVLGSPVTLVTTALFMVAVDRWFIRLEEASAACAFGQAYESYRGKVRRWL